MASTRKIDPANVVWHAPETIHLTLPDVAEKFSKRVEGASPEEVVKAANELSGQFREYLGEKEVNGRLIAQYGSDPLVWVSDAPDDPKDGKGHYEVYKGDEGDYRPVLQRPAED